MTIATQLFYSENLRLAAVDAEKDAVLESTWTHDLSYAALRRDIIAHPLSVEKIKKLFQEIVKDSNDKGNQFLFSIRVKADDRLIGFIHLPWIGWSNQVAFLRIGIAEAADLRQYGSEALGLALGFIFNELNLFRVTAPVPEYALEYIGLYERAGFMLEVRQREMSYHAGQRWDMWLYGFLAEDWIKLQKAVE
jgi:RimJ/RimL family protein N-acetyltransferase